MNQKTLDYFSKWTLFYVKLCLLGIILIEFSFFVALMDYFSFGVLSFKQYFAQTFVEVSMFVIGFSLAFFIRDFKEKKGLFS